MKNMRPTSGKVRSALFNILGSAGLLDVDFLDLFAGAGQIAALALRMGARSALCVESDRASSSAVTALLRKHGFDAPTALCLASDVRRAVPRLAREARSFGVVFADPPYCMGWGETLPRLMAENWNIVAPGGVFAFEHSSRDVISDIFVPRDDRIYGETVISFYWKPEAS
ncbi:MAG: RsmD family RNA methyltransferase [Synergistaceae bacterium]|jgi:16S rRNA (guanine(966)-N(2))-methyltransferase RsmD|nr:RsmD family RNA methyltransferase [Synergistaceae bacterium]